MILNATVKAKIAETVMSECETPFLCSFAARIHDRFYSISPDAHNLVKEYLTHVWYFVRQHGCGRGNDLRADYVLLCLIHDLEELTEHLKRSGANVYLE